MSMLLNRIASFCATARRYGSEVSTRQKLSESKFRSAGDDAGRRGIFDNIQFAPFLLQAKNAVETIAFCWSSRLFSLIRGLEAAQERCRQEFAEYEACDLDEIVKRCKRQLGFVPRFNPFRNELFGGALLGGGIIEFFLNSSALETAGQSENLTRILAGILSLAFVAGVDLLGKHRARRKPILLPTLLLTGLIVGITLIREDAVVGYMTHIQESVPELGAGVADPRVYVLLFLGVQLLFFYIAYHWSVQHHDPLLSECHDGKKADRSRRSCNATLESIDRRLDNIAVECLNEWGEHQRFFDHRVLVFAEAVEAHRDAGHMIVARLDLAVPPIVTWSRVRLSNRQSPTGIQLPSNESKDHVTAPFIAVAICLALAGRASAEAQPVTHLAELIDLSPSMKPYRAQQLAAVKKTLESWKPTQAIDILGVSENPIGRAPIGHIDAFPYDGAISNPARYRIDSTILRK